MHIYLSLYNICIKDYELKIYMKVLFRTWKSTLPNVESLNVFSLATGTNCFSLGEKNPNQIPELNLAEPCC